MTCSKGATLFVRCALVRRCPLVSNKEPVEATCSVLLMCWLRAGPLVLLLLLTSLWSRRLLSTMLMKRVILVVLMVL